MAADESRAARIRALKDEHPSVTWRQIADAVGVSERSVSAWAASGAMAYPNAKKLAAFFRSIGAQVSDDYIWRGETPATPDLMAVLPGTSPDGDLTDLHSKVDEALERLSRMEMYLEAQASEAVRQRVARAARQRRPRPDRTREDQGAEGG